MPDDTNPGEVRVCLRSWHKYPAAAWMALVASKLRFTDDGKMIVPREAWQAAQAARRR